MSMSIKTFKELFPSHKLEEETNIVTPKYRAKKVEIDGVKFDSKKEANYAKHLALLAQQGLVDTITYQPRYVLQEKFNKNGIHFRAINYVADFAVVYSDGHVEVVDVKGFRTPVYKIKRKMFELKYPDLTLKEV